MEEAGVEVALEVGGHVTGRKASAERRRGKPHVVERDGVAAGAAHAQRVPVVVDDDTRRVARHQGVAVSLAPAVVA